MALISKNVDIHKPDDIANKCNNTYDSTVKMKPVDASSNVYIGFNKENNQEGPKFKVGDYVGISKYEAIFAKGYISNWSEKAFELKGVKNTVLCTYVISNLKVEKLVATFYENELQKANQKAF